MDQQSQIRKKQWLPKLELEEIQIRIEDKPHGHAPVIAKVKMSDGF